MFKIEFLPTAKKDIDNIIYYISNNLKNISAAKKIKDLFISSLDNVALFPYGYPIYQPFDTLENEYRYYRVNNFLIFYTINDREKSVTITRVLYQKMDISEILE